MSHKKGKVLTSQSREIILAVDRYFEQEKNMFSNIIEQITLLPKEESGDSSSGVVVPTDIINDIMNFATNTQKVTERVATATDTSKNTVSRIRSEGAFARTHSSKVTSPQKGKRGPAIQLDNLDLCALRNIINGMYDAQKRVPTIAKILLKAKEDFNFPGGKTTLRKIMKNNLGYKFKKCSQKGLQLTERPNIRVWRARYLRRIRQNDALGSDKKCVVYLDETWIHSSNIISESLHSAKDEVQKCGSPENLWIMISAGKEYGFINGAKAIWKNLTKTQDYEQMSGDTFFAWASNTLLPKLPAKSIVVMNNASYLGVEANKVPTLTSRKSVMQEWLMGKGIAFPSDLTKVELYECIRKNHTPEDFDIDNLMRSHGHEVLWLPPYNCDLNPIEYMWQLVKQRVAQKSVGQTESKIEALTKEALQSITAEDWSKEIEHVKMIEQRYWDKEQVDNIEEFNINTVDGSDNMTTEEESTDDDDSFGENMSGITGIQLIE